MNIVSGVPREGALRMSRSALPPIAAIDIASRVWTFGVRDRTFARQVRLLPDGRISGYIHDNETAWRMEDGLLTFLGRNGVPTARFAHRRDDEHGVVLWGPHLPDPSQTVILAETRPAQTLAADMSRFPIDRHASGHVPGERRRNLVMVFANHKSLHLDWIRDIPDAERSWDLCVSFYGPADHYAHIGVAEFSSLQTGVFKGRSAHAAFAAHSLLWAYDRIWFADDDLMTGWRDINRLFAIAGEHDLLLAQPALAEGSHVAHGITRRQPGMKLRYTSFVESMAPLFTREALRLCVPVFQDQRHGYGIDYVWSWLLGAARDRMAIVDAVGVVHTRPQTTAYDPAANAREEQMLLAMYGVTPRVEEYGHLRDTRS